MLPIPVIALGILIGVVVAYNKWLKRYIGKDNRDRYFAQLFKDFPKLYNFKTRLMKKRIFEALASMGEDIRILEIGIGPGANFAFYPKTKCHLIANEPNPYFYSIMKENICKIILHSISPLSADNLQDIPDSSVDAVISTMVLCSVPRVESVLREILRVLKPGGKFLYMEHVIDPANSWWRKVQKLLDVFRIWSFLFDGCHASRSTGSVIRNAGFQLVDQQRFYLDPIGFWGLYIIKPHVYGFAVKG